MIKVKTLAAHRNQFGERVEKEPGDVYELPEDQATMLAGEKLVEPVADKKARVQD